MADEIKEVRTERVQEGNETVARQSISHTTSDQPINKVQQVVYFLYGILAGLLTLRFVLALFGANRSNGFADFIYGVTGPFVAPFRSLFNVDTDFGFSRFEIETIVAIIVYGLLAWVIARAFGLAKSHPDA